MNKTKVSFEWRDWLRVQGSDAERFLQGMLTCDVKKAGAALKSSQKKSVVAGGLLLNAKGRVVSPLWLSVESSDLKLFWLSVPGGMGPIVLAALDHYLVADDVELVLVDEGQAPFASRVVRVLSDDGRLPETLAPTVPGARDEIFIPQNNGADCLVVLPQSYGCFAEKWFARSGPLNEEYEEVTPDEALSARIHFGVPEWRRDFNEESLVLEFPFSSRISFHKGCYIGQEVVARGTYRGKLNRLFARFESQDGAPLREDLLYSLKDPSKPVGKITSAFREQGLGLVRLSSLGEPAADRRYQELDLFQTTPEGAQIRIRSVTLLE